MDTLTAANQELSELWRVPAEVSVGVDGALVEHWHVIDRFQLAPQVVQCEPSPW